jgi:hypothetical protein
MRDETIALYSGFDADSADQGGAPAAAMRGQFRMAR